MNITFKNEMLNAASDMISDFGDNIQYQQTVSNGYDPVTDKDNKTVKKYTVKAVFMNIDEKQRELGTPVNSEMNVMIAAKGLSFTPELNDVIVRNKETWNVVDVATDPANATYTLRVRA